MKFTTQTGKILELSSKFTTKDYSIRVTGENTDFYTLVDTNGISVQLAKDIFESKHYNENSEQIVLSETLYNHYFAVQLQKIADDAEFRFNHQFANVLANKELILSVPEYFLIRSFMLASGDTIRSSGRYCIGALLEAWQLSDNLVLPTEQGKLHMISISGSMLSGSFSGVAWSFEKNDLVTITNKTTNFELPGGLSSWVGKFAELSQHDYPTMLGNVKAINKLLNEIA